ncbi:MAG: type IX secretion system plug protein domain-containing protein [Bacteroidales bacterium]
MREDNIKPGHIRKLFFLTVIFTLFLSSVSGQAPAIPYSDMVYHQNIKTVNIHRKGWEISHPVINLHGDNSLLLTFDDLADSPATYNYIIEHCNNRWEPSGLTASEYLQGFPDNLIEDYGYSFNTHYDFIHYSLELPNNDLQFKLSGNYIIKVYKDYDENDIAFIKRFHVTENLAQVTGTVKRPITDDLYHKGQKIEFTVDYRNLNLQDPSNTVVATVSQNNRPDKTTRVDRSTFNDGQFLEYNYADNQLVFLAGNEFRNLDLKSVKYLAPGLAEIKYQPPYFHFYLKPDDERYMKNYSYHEDLNGRYLIDVQDSKNDGTDADYVNVHFYLPMEAPIVDGEVFVHGNFSNWNCRYFNKMEYNFDKKQYEATILMKQGFYNYQYVVFHDEKGTIDDSYIEGSYFQTENDYLIIVYYYDRINRYDRIIGTTIINSLHRQ